MNPPKLDSRWNTKREEVTHKIGKAGTSAFLLFNTDELTVLRTLIERAIGPLSHTASGGKDVDRVRA